jgi:hypothetical protein
LLCLLIVSKNAYKRRYKKRVMVATGEGIQSSSQTRTNKNPEPVAERVSGPIIAGDEFDLHWHMRLSVPDPLDLERFIHHERLLHTVDCFICGVFDGGNKGWLASTIDFVSPHRGEGPSLYFQWRSVSDRCHSVALLIRAGQQGRAEATLEGLFQELGALTRHRHPAFIVTFWRLCLRLLGVDTHIPQANSFGRLLSLVKESWPETDSVFLLAKSLTEMDPSDIRNALRIGYLKSIRTMAQMIGDENLMVLEMVSYYCKFFETHYLVRDALLAKFEFVLHQTRNTHSANSRPAIAVSYAFAYAAYYALDCPVVALGNALGLRDAAVSSPQLAEPTRWGLEAEAFAFASKTVAEMYRQQVSRAANLASVADEYSKCCASMQAAIQRLEHGDRECRTRAAMLSTTLNRWFVEWGLQKEADEEGRRTRRILDTVDGKMCRRCIRIRYCNDCGPLIAAGILRPDADGAQVESWRWCLRCKAFKQSWFCQRCKIRESKVGWQPSHAWVEEHRERTLASHVGNCTQSTEGPG